MPDWPEPTQRSDRQQRPPAARVHASSLCVPKTSPQSALRSGPSLAQSEGSDSPDVSVTPPTIGSQPLRREPCPSSRAGQKPTRHKLGGPSGPLGLTATLLTSRP